MNHRFRIAVLSVCVGLPIAMVGGCSSSGDGGEKATKDGPSAGLNALDRDEAGEAVDLSDRSDAGTRRLFDAMEAGLANANVNVDAPPPARRTPAQPDLKVADAPAPDLVESSTENDPAAEVEPDLTEAEAAANAHAALPEVADAKEALVAELARLLTARAKDASDPTGPLLQLAALELLGAPSGTLPPEPDAQALERLSPRERSFLTQWRKLLSEAGSGMKDSGDVSSLAQRVSALAAELSSFEPLATPRAVLARSVDGFGMFDELPRSSEGAYQFLAGRSARAVVYVEVAGHTFKEKSRGGVAGFEVGLTQELRLYHAARDEDTLAWQRPAADITDFSRNRRREFFITQVVELPRTLSVGAYRLKIRVSDRAGGATAEAVIPIEVLADASAMAGEK